MTLSKKINIKYSVDARGAKRGLDSLKKGNDDVRDSVKEAAARIKSFDRAVRDSNKATALKGSIMRDASASAGGLAGSLSGLTATMGGPAGIIAAATAGAFAISELASKADSLAQRSMQLTAVFANVPIPIEAARRQTQGLVTDFDLARLASDAVSLQITENSKEFANLSEALAKLGARRGVDALKSIEDGFSAIGRNSTELLDNLGVTLKVSQAQDEYARSLGKTTKELTDVEKAEAFREVATRKVIDAARGVTLDTDGAAAAVRRFNVELQNIQDQALGGSAATVSLAEGLRQVASTGEISTTKIRNQGVAAAELKNQLRDLGVSSLDLVLSNQKLADAAGKANTQVSRLAGLEELRRQKSASDPAAQRLAKQADLEARNLATAKERLLAIEEEQAYLSSNNDAIQQKTALSIEALKIQSLIAGAAGDEAKALQLARQVKLAELKELGRPPTTRRRSGRKKDPFLQERLEFQQQLTESLNAERRREFSEAVTLQRSYLQDVQAYERELAAAQQPQIDRMQMANAELIRRTALQQAALDRELELANVNGDPATAFAIEQEQFALREEALRRQLDLETQVGERERIEDELSQVRHDRTVSRIEEEKRAREELMRTITSTINSVSAAEQGAFTLSSTIAGASIKGEERKKKALDRIKAAGLYADAGVAAAQSVIAFASLNIPQGIALAAASANAFAQGTIIAAGNARGGGGGSASAGSASQFGSGQPSSAPAAFTIERGAPVSVRDGVEGNPNNTGQAGGGRSNARTINIERIDVLGSIDDDSANKIRKGLQRSEANLGG